MRIGERIKEHRKRLGYSQEKIAEMVGISRQAVTKWESGRSVPCMENLMLLANIFGITLSELTGHTDDQASDEPVAETIPATRKFLVTDIAFVGAALFAVWNLSRIPVLIGYSLLGFILILLQALAILFLPLYLVWIRPRQKERAALREKKTYTKEAIVTRILWALGSLAALGGSYVISRHDVLGQWHNMNSWPFNLFVTGGIAIVLASFSHSRLVMGGTVIGYLSGFVLAWAFNSDYAGPGDTLDSMSYNTGWMIWTYTYLAMIAAGILATIILRRVKGRPSSRR